MNLNIDAVKDMTYDAIVVGSGVSGGWAAKELTEKGLRVLMLERGRPLEHVTGYETEQKAPWELSEVSRLGELSAKYPQTPEDVAKSVSPYWMPGMDTSYRQDKPFRWLRPNIVGGKSIMWGRQSYRFSDIDFEANAKEGVGVDWPIRYKDIAPWYSYVEKFAGVSGEKLGLPQLPDSEFLPPMDMFLVEKEVRKRIEKSFPGRIMTIGRTANLSEAQKVHVDNGRAPCQYRNQCIRGCPYGAYFSTQSCTLPPAVKTGRLTLRPNSVVTEVIYDPKKQRASGVRVKDSVTLESQEYFAKVIFVCASAMASTALLMNSVSDRFPNGMGNDSDQLGHNLMDHHFRLGANGQWEGGQDRYFYGRRANGIYIPRYRNIGTDKRDYLRGFGYQGGGGRQGWQHHVAELAFGTSLKEDLTRPGLWTMGLIGFGEQLPEYRNRMYLDKTRLDKWGLPTLAFDAEIGENERKMRVDMINDAQEMLEAAGLVNVKTYDQGSVVGGAVHEMGTARMGRDPKTSVLNGHNQIHAVKNVFVTDGACMTSSGCVNPSLTYMALSARAADFAVQELKAQRI
ncbi:GMC oxidoreductase [Spirosoma endophyticum]|uniref:Choline dehydrogenase n=1 Tax=Spirosoma endophyticum TaxID=662367 RepID=A0A1I1MFG7_9BACT|nr:GMC family oxidoreductase [Spirosoma endophyticum]SFC81393.1 Choline dehydrogenase [Spirosoma endophyticum]